MLRDEVAPALRALGMKGSGQNYVLPHPDALLLLGFQKSTSSDATRVRFTVNLALIDKEEYAEKRESWWGVTPTATLRLPVGRYGRIADVLPTRQDQWWVLAAGAPTRDLAADVVSAIEQYALPELAQARTSGGW
jgi:hypothetical protein